MALPMKLDGDRATVIEDVPPGTGIGDLIGAFSPIGPHMFFLCESPTVVRFETKLSTAHALIVWRP
jgi:hypothetical protein